MHADDWRHLGNFMCLYDHLSTFLSSFGSSIPLREQLFSTLLKLSHSTSFDLLVHISGIPKTTLLYYFLKGIDLLHAKIYFLVKWQDQEDTFKTFHLI